MGAVEQNRFEGFFRILFGNIQTGGFVFLPAPPTLSLSPSPSPVSPLASISAQRCICWGHFEMYRFKQGRHSFFFLSFFLLYPLLTDPLLVVVVSLSLLAHTTIPLCIYYPRLLLLLLLGWPHSFIHRWCGHFHQRSEKKHFSFSNRSQCDSMCKTPVPPPLSPFCQLLSIKYLGTCFVLLLLLLLSYLLLRHYAQTRCNKKKTKKEFARINKLQFEIELNNKANRWQLHGGIIKTARKERKGGGKKQVPERMMSKGERDFV